MNNVLPFFDMLIQAVDAFGDIKANTQMFVDSAVRWQKKLLYCKVFVVQCHPLASGTKHFKRKVGARFVLKFFLLVTVDRLRFQILYLEFHRASRGKAFDFCLR